MQGPGPRQRPRSLNLPWSEAVYVLGKTVERNNGDDVSFYRKHGWP